MKTLSCRDMGGDCNFVAQGNSNEEVVKMMMSHAMQAHPEKLKSMGNVSPEEMNQMMMSKMKDA